LVKALHMSESQAGYFHRVAQRARGVPELKEALLSGKISLSQARRIVGVINDSNASEWIEAAQSLKQKELERKVAEESPRRKVHEGIVPLADNLSKLTVVITVEEEEKLERVRDLVSQGLQKPASYQDTVSSMVNLYLDKKDPVRKAERASSRTSTRESKRRESRETPSQKRQAIRAHIKHEVHSRDGFRCAYINQTVNAAM
jgi:hypothetical protein